MSSGAASRKRRAAAASSGSDATSNGFDAYNLQGDAKAALSIFQQQHQEAPTMASKYNVALLSHLTNSNSRDGMDQLSQKLQDLELEFRKTSQQETLSARKRRRNELIFSYNRALILHAQGNSQDAAKICQEQLADLLASKTRPPEELAHVSSRMALLWLECILTLGLPKDHEADRILTWLDIMDSEKDAQLKFLINLYRSRYNLTELDDSGKHCDNKIRAARKELKQAMDLLQNKLRSSFGAETGSVVSSSNSEENNSTQSPLGTTNALHYESQVPQGSIVLQRHNQAALSLKAHSEQLKGNTKKSLILCSEAHATSAMDPSYETTHANNLAIVYETNGKRHLALHALSKGLDASRRQESDSSTTATDICFYPDGTARPDHTLVVMHNAAICALQARRYQSAYEYMATCLAQSPIFEKQSRSWLCLAEACVGLYILQIQASEQRKSNFKAIMVKE